FFHWHQHFTNKVGHFLGFDPLLDAVFDLLLLARQSMNDKPLALHGHNFENTAEKMTSTPTVNPPNNASEMATTRVEPFNSSQVGQLHLCSSSQVSLVKLETAVRW